MEMKHDARRKRLNAWKIWYEYCEDEHVSVEKILASNHPNFLVTDFIVYMCEKKITPSARLNAKSAAIYLLEQVKNVKEIGKDRMVKEFLAMTATSLKSRPRYTAVWDLTILLNYIRRSPPPSSQTMTQLVPRVCALLMVFAMARPVEVFRISLSGLMRTNADQQWSIPTHRKTDKGKETSFLTLMRLPDKAICPVVYFEELLKRHLQSKLPLFHWDNGRPLTSVAAIYACVSKLLWEAGIPTEYKCYSIRHATITKLYMAGNDNVQVKTFSGHPQRSNTAAKYYLHRVDKWLGFDLAAAPAAPKSIVPQLVGKNTPKVQQTQSDNEQDNSESEDVDDPDSEVVKQEPMQAPAPTFVPPVKKGKRKTRSVSPTRAAPKYPGSRPARPRTRPKTLSICV
jgi:hypothetical protein